MYIICLFFVIFCIYIFCLCPILFMIIFYISCIYVLIKSWLDFKLYYFLRFVMGSIKLGRQLEKVALRLSEISLHFAVGLLIGSNYLHFSTVISKGSVKGLGHRMEIRERNLERKRSGSEWSGPFVYNRGFEWLNF